MKMNISDLIELKIKKRKFAVLSCYDFITARLAFESGIRVLLAGDSAAQAVLGYDSTLPAKMDFMIEITAAIRRGAPEALIIADMPFLSYQTSKKDALLNAGRFVTEAGAQIIKIEANLSTIDTIKYLADAGICLMSHIGLRPQNILKLGKYKASGITATDGIEVMELAEKMVLAGASSLLLEATAEEIAELITQKVEVPVIGCGSGSGCDGQVLIAPDILGLSEGIKPKFSKNYADISQEIKKALSKYCKDVTTGVFPDKAHSYHMKNTELSKLEKFINYRSS